jgi:hypothetical protein
VLCSLLLKALSTQSSSLSSGWEIFTVCTLHLLFPQAISNCVLSSSDSFPDMTLKYRGRTDLEETMTIAVQVQLSPSIVQHARECALRLRL